MTTSSKKKKDKKKDFQVRRSHSLRITMSNSRQKPKLRVGKAAPKAANSTSTSFKAKCTTNHKITDAEEGTNDI